VPLTQHLVAHEAIGAASAQCRVLHGEDGRLPAAVARAFHAHFPAVGARLDGGKLRDVRVAFGAVAPTPIRAPRTEAALEGRAPDAGTLEAASQVALQEVRPISDLRGSDWYRRELIHNMLKRALTHVCQL